MKRRHSDKVKVLSVFTGVGGLDLGLESAGFHTIGCIELDDAARSTLQANRPSWYLVEPCDISKIDPAAVRKSLGLAKGELHVLSAGPPCQPFSNAAQWSVSAKAGMRDRRSKCIRALFGLIKACLPKAVLLENVRGFAQGSTSALPFCKLRLPG